MKHFQFIICFFFASNCLFSQTVVVEISGIRNTVGLIRLAFFANETDFRSDKPAFGRTHDKTLVLNGNLVVRLDHIPSGTYGIALLDDENKNGKLDYRLVIPKEGFGFSNYEHRGIKRPALSDFSFLLKKNETLRVPIRIKYY